MKKKICVVLVMCFLLISTMSTVSAGYVNSCDYENAVNMATVFACNVLGESEYEAIIELLDFNDNIQYLFFDYGDSGYVVVDIDNNIIAEACKDKNEYIVDDSMTYYYNGPLAYYKKDGEQFINLASGDCVEAEFVREVEPELTNSIGTDNIMMMRGNIDYEVVVSGTVPSYYYNVDGTCGSTATAMWLAYMDRYVDDRYVLPAFSTALDYDSGEGLVRYLIPYIDGVLGGSGWYQRKTGLQNYLDDIGIDRTINSVGSWSASVLKQCINNDCPVIVGLGEEPTYDEHVVIAYGYCVSAGTNIERVIVNDGRGNSGVYISVKYIEDLVY